jgi:mono/diheme cytochrome c family protein
MGRAIQKPRRVFAAISGLGLCVGWVALAVIAWTPAADADWPWHRQHRHSPCGKPGCTICRSPEGGAGEWYWVRSPDQEQRVVMSLYNRYCIRCHGIDGRGVWDIPDVPDFTDTRWQHSRADKQIANIVMEGRGACMPAFRGTLNLEEAWGMARYLRTFVPGTEVPRPEVGRSSAAHAGAASTESLPPLPAAAGSAPPAQPAR